MTLHGEEVELGDLVYDVSVNRGPGEVVETGGNMLTVSFRGRVRKQFHSNGKQMGADMVTLFWHNPIFTNPQKNEISFQDQREIAGAVKEALMRAER